MPMDVLPGHDVISANKFKLELDGVDIGSFREVSGMGSETTVIDFQQTTDNGEMTIKKLPGHHKWGDVTLKRGYTDDMTLFNWRQEVIDGQIDSARRNGSIVVYDFANQEVLRWNFVNAWPSKLSASNLSSSSDEALIEELTIVHEGIERQK